MASFLLYGALVLLAVAYYYLSKYKKQFRYFEEKDIPQIKTEFYYGNARDLMQKKKCRGELMSDMYYKFKEKGVKHGGIYFGTTPMWVPIDPELIKTILVSDFTYFSAHNPQFPGLMCNNLFHMGGEKWKDMRRKLTPTFTSGKMKMMFDIILEKSNGLTDLVGDMSKTGEPAEIKELLARFTTDVIGNCGFGIECNSIEDVNSEFFQQGQDIFRNIDNLNPSPTSFILYKMGLRKMIFPDFSGIENFFRNVVKQTVAYREDNKVVRKDFLHLMIQLKNKGVITELTHANEDVFEKTVNTEVISMEEIAGECLLFFTAGFETSSTTMSYALLELTQNQDVQKKLREEVRNVLNRHNGKFSYEALQEMTYCDNVVHETLRKYPPVASLPRICTKNYTIPGTDILIEKDTLVGIPVWGIQMDPDYFPDPHKFIPERFNSENKSSIKDFTYLPFGEGPRMCLGLRFGVMQSKAGLATLINRYNFTLHKNTPYPPEFKPTADIIAVKGGIWLNATKVD